MAQVPTEVFEDNKGRRASVNDEGRVKGITLAFQVRYSSTLLFIDDLFTANDGITRIPFVGEPYENDPDLKVDGYGHESIDRERRVFRVLVFYKNATLNTELPPDNPLDEPWVISVDNAEEKVIADDAYFLGSTNDSTFDIGGLENPRVEITNRAFDFYDPPPTKTSDDLILNLTKNKAIFNASQALEFKNSVNKETITIAGIAMTALQGKLTKYNSGGPLRERNGVSFWAVTYQIRVKDFQEATWITRFANVGYNYIDGDGNYLSTRIKGKIPTKPQWLTSEGNLTENQASDDAINYLSYLIEEPKNFADLELPDSAPIS